MAIDGVNNVNIDTRIEKINTIANVDDNIVLFGYDGGDKEPKPITNKEKIDLIKNEISENYPQYEFVSVLYDEATNETLVRIKIAADVYPVTTKTGFFGKSKTTYEPCNLGSIKKDFGLGDHVLREKGPNSKGNQFPYGNQELLEQRYNEDIKNNNHYDKNHNYVMDKMELHKNDEINIPLSQIDLEKFIIK